MFDPTELKVAESAFVGAVAEALKLQDQMLELRMQLQQIDERASQANEAAMRELGFDEATPPDDIFQAQERFLRLAIERSELDEDRPVIKAARNQLKQMRENYEAAVQEEANTFGRFQGPALG